MNNTSDHSTMPERENVKNKKNNLVGYPAYPAGEDIYDKYHQERDINPEDPSKTKALNEETVIRADYDKESKTDISGRDLDIPGSELDDTLEDVGSEDEENNYYSLGGDAHNGLEEDQGI